MLNLVAPPRGAVASYPWLDQLLLTEDRPSVGRLMSLCEENYARLRRLAPDLAQWRGEYRSSGRDGMDLHLEVIEQARYTSLTRLTYFFPFADGLEHHILEADPDALLRVYHDARQVEIIDLRQTALPLHHRYRYPALEAKWRANLFIGKWLSYCLGTGHGFGPAAAATPALEPSRRIAP